MRPSGARQRAFTKLPARWPTRRHTTIESVSDHEPLSSHAPGFGDCRPLPFPRRQPFLNRSNASFAPVCCSTQAKARPRVDCLESMPSPRLRRILRVCCGRNLTTQHGSQRRPTSTSRSKPSSAASLPHASGADPAGHYGFYWWTNGRQRSGTQPWPDAPPRTYAAQGGSGNFCFVIPDWSTVVVRLGTNALKRSATTDALWNKFLGQVGAAVRGSADTIIQPPR